MSEIIIAHSVYKWLNLTENWIYNQIHWQNRFRNIVIAHQQLRSSPVIEDLYVLDQHIFLCRISNVAAKRLLRRDFLKSSILSGYEQVLVHSHFGPMGWGDLCIKRKNRQVTRFYGYDIDKLPIEAPIWIERYKRLFDNCNAFLVEGPFMKKRLVHRGCPSEKIYVHHLGTDITRLPYRNRVNDGQLHILLAGRFTEKKGFIYGLKGIAKAYNDGKYRGMTVTIVGDAGDSVKDCRYKEKMISVIENEGLAHIVKLVGRKSYDELIAIALEHNVFLQPSITTEDGDMEGGYPVVLLDMMATGMPVISTKHCDIPEVISDGRFGILCDERNSDQIGNALCEIAERKITFSSDEISRKIRDKFNWTTRGEDLADIYEKIINL